MSASVELSTFKFEDSEIAAFVDSDRRDWFRATEVCQVLGIGNSYTAVNRYAQEYSREWKIGAGRPALYVSEPGLYALIFASKTDAAKRFQRWVFEDVLPKLRSQGGYIMSDATLAQLEGLESQIRMMKADIERADMVIAAQGDRIEVLENECKALLEPSIYRQAIERLIATQLRYRSGVNSWVPLSNLYSRLQSVWESWYTDVPMPSLSEFTFAARTYFEGVHKRKDHPIKMDLNCPLGDVINCELVSPKTAEIDPGIVKTIKLMTGGKVR